MKDLVKRAVDILFYDAGYSIDLKNMDECIAMVRVVIQENLGDVAISDNEVENCLIKLYK